MYEFRTSETVRAGDNFMESLSDKFGNLINLETLHLGSTIPELEGSNFQNGNWIKILPDLICDLRKLTKMNINENQIASLPKCFGLPKFRSLAVAKESVERTS